MQCDLIQSVNFKMAHLPSSEGDISVIQACRACLDTKSINYIPFDSEGGVWTELYQFCAGLLVMPESGSQLLCHKCADLIKDYAEFKKQCQKSEEFWCSLLLEDVKFVTNNIKIKIEENVHPNEEKNALDDSYFTKDNKHEEIEAFYENTASSDKDFESLREHSSDETESETKPYNTRKSKLRNNFKTWNCDKCQRKYKNRKWLKAHLETCQGQRIKPTKKKPKEPSQNEVMYCGLCDFTSNRDLMRQHLDNHALSNDLNCVSCDYVGKDFASMVSHRYSHQPEDLKPILFCHLCSDKIRSCISLQYHYRTVHLKKQGLDCTMCDKSFKTYKSWRNHDRWHRVDRYICDVCGKKFLFRHAIETHLIDHAEYNKYICETCGRGFKRLYNLKSHVTHRHLTHALVKCSHCNKTFKSEYNLQKHLRLVTKEKPFSCPVCPKKFPSEITLKNHMFWHSDERPYGCEICGSKYKAKSQLKIHMRQHTGIMPFKCQNCEKSFASSNQLRVHTSVHTGIRRHKCNFCHRTFHSRKLVESHCAAQHKDKEIKIDINMSL